MSTNAPESPPGGKRHSWLWLAVIWLFLALHSPLLGQDAPITVSRETTYITEPLGPDGLPDYEQYVLDKYRAGVTPENNAAVLLIQAIGRGYLDQTEHEVICKELGLESIPSEYNVLVTLGSNELKRQVWAWMCQKHGEMYCRCDPNTVNWSMAENVIERAVSHPWTSDDLSPLDNWVSENQRSLDLIVSASQRTRYCWPPPLLIDSRDALMIEMTVTDANIREAARSLSVRAMLNLGEGDAEKAWHDIAAIFRLAQLVGQGHLLVDRLMAMSINWIACEGTIAILSSNNLNGELASRIHRFLSEADEFSSLSDVLHDVERVQAIDALLYAKKRGLNSIAETNSESVASEPIWSSIDWNIVLANVNRKYDQLVAISRLPSWQAQKQELSSFEKSLKESSDLAYEDQQGDELLSRANSSQAMSAILTELLVTDRCRAVSSERLANTRLELTRIAATLAMYRAERGEYSEKLEELVPRIVHVLPKDLYHEMSFIYHRDADGYLLYSAGKNGQDDSGSYSYSEVRIFAGRDIKFMDEEQANELRWEIPAEADDISIRVPTPPFKLPEPEHSAPGQ